MQGYAASSEGTAMPRGHVSVWFAHSRLTLPKEPVPSVRSIMYCPTRFGLLDACDDDFERPPGAGGAGRVAISAV